MRSMFGYAKSFDRAIDNFNFSKIKNLETIFFYTKKFEERFNDCIKIPTSNEDFKKWFEKNKQKMKEISNS